MESVAVIVIVTTATTFTLLVATVAGIYYKAKRKMKKHLQEFRNPSFGIDDHNKAS